jgi:hypothetical protein
MTVIDEDDPGGSRALVLDGCTSLSGKLLMAGEAWGQRYRVAEITSFLRKSSSNM